MSAETLPELASYPPVSVADQDGGVVNGCEGKWWGSFRQFGFAQPHHTAEGLIKKVVLVSVPLPPGTEDKGRTVLTNRSWYPLADSDVTPFNDDDTLLGSVQETGRETVDDDLLDIFELAYDETERAIIPEDLNLQSDPVQEYLALQQTRREEVGRLKDLARFLLSTPKYMRTSPWESNFGGAILVEMIAKGGRLFSLGSNGQEMEINHNLAVGNFGHAGWLDWLPERVNKGNGVLVIDDFDGTRTVSECGNSEGCSAFFKKVLKGAQSIVGKVHGSVPNLIRDVSSIVHGSELWHFAFAGTEKDVCSNCKGQKGSSTESKQCTCNQESN